MQKTDNRTVGGRFEQELSHIMADAGFWVHVLQQNKSGQPADIIAIRGHYHTLIDCKVISDDKGFPFERIEDNQRSAMKMFHKKAFELCYFAFRLPDGTMWMISLERMETMKNRNRKRMTDNDIRTQAWPLEKWLKASETWGDDM